MFSFENILKDLKLKSEKVLNRMKTVFKRVRFEDFFRKNFKYIISATALLLLIGITNIFQLKIGYEVIIDGEEVGLVTDEKVAYDAITSVEEDLKKYVGEDISYKREPVFSRRLVSGKSLSDIDDIKQNLFANIDYMTKSLGVYIEGEPLFAVENKDMAEDILITHKEALAGIKLDGSIKAEFIERVDVKEAYHHISLSKSKKEALLILAGENNKKAKDYVVKEDDTLWNIANAHSLSVERLLALNTQLSENIKAGDVLKVEENVPILSVRTVIKETYTKDIPFEEELLKDETLYENTSAIQQAGIMGKEKLTDEVTKINGEETSRKSLKIEEISKPVKQIKRVGTKKRPLTTGSGTFLRPTVGSLSSRYGSRWGRTHTGIDIQGAYGTPIMAADGGVVTFAGWEDGYGNYIIINHENGYQTAYAHCSTLSKKVGDRVKKGETIAKMGNSGRVTGTHLHFEVKKNGAFCDPLKFVSY